MNTVLIIDDEKDLADEVKLAVEAGIAGAACTIELKFERSAEQIARLRPDAIVLDLMEGHQSAIRPGQQTWKSVWETTFCPIIIYTGSDADLQPPVPATHPFVKRIQKGGGTLAAVVDALKSFAPAVESVSRLRAEVDAVIHKVLRDTAGEGHMPMNDGAYLLHAGRRRIAASMDDSTITGQRKMASWEIYLLPAIGTDPLTADLLLKRGSAKDNSESYRIVLSPSCDLVRGGKIKSVLAAICSRPKVMLEKFSSTVKPKGETELKEQLGRLVLTQGCWNGWMPLPAFADVIPNSVANLKDLELIPITSIGPADSTTHDFVRIASIDSPYREQVAWAYLTTAARPGMPDRDLQQWADEFVKAAGNVPAALTPANPNQPGT